MDSRETFHRELRELFISVSSLLVGLEDRVLTIKIQGERKKRFITIVFNDEACLKL